MNIRKTSEQLAKEADKKAKADLKQQEKDAKANIKLQTRRAQYIKEAKYNKFIPKELMNDEDKALRAKWCEQAKITADETRARRASMREWANVLGSQEMVDPNTGDVLTRDAIVILQQYNLAMMGDTKAAQFLADIRGEYTKVDLPGINQVIQLKID